MPSYLIESYLPRSRSGELTAVVGRLRRATETLTAEGTHVRHLRSTFVPTDGFLVSTCSRRSRPRRSARRVDVRRSSLREWSRP